MSLIARERGRRLSTDRTRKELEDAKALIDALAAEENVTHRYLIERNYAAVTRDAHTDASVIRYLFSLPAPTRALRLYFSGRTHLAFCENKADGTRKLDFKPGVSNRKYRTSLKWFYGILYVLFAAIALLPKPFAKQLFRCGLAVRVGCDGDAIGIIRLACPVLSR